MSSQGFSTQLDLCVAEGAAAAIGRQDTLNQFMAANPGEWTVDLGQRTISQGGLVLGDVTFLGSYSELNQDWQWGWAGSRHGWESPAVAPMQLVYDTGVERSVPELTYGEFTVADFADPQQAVATLAIAAGVILGGNGLWATGADNGQTLVFLHINDRQVPPTPFDINAVKGLLNRAAEVFPSDPRLIARGYFQHYGVPFTETGNELSADSPQGVVKVAFDGGGRLVDVVVDGTGV